MKHVFVLIPKDYCSLVNVESRYQIALLGYHFTHHLQATLRKVMADCRFNPMYPKRHKKGEEVVSLCIELLLLTSTGLINHKQCITHGD